MKRTTWIVLAGLLVVASASGCGTAENPMGPSFAARNAPAPGVETAVGTMPVDEVPEDGISPSESFDPVDARGQSGKPKKDHPVHPVHPEHPEHP